MLDLIVLKAFFDIFSLFLPNWYFWYRIFYIVFPIFYLLSSLGYWGLNWCWLLWVIVIVFVCLFRREQKQTHYRPPFSLLSIYIFFELSHNPKSFFFYCFSFLFLLSLLYNIFFFFSFFIISFFSFRFLFFSFFFLNIWISFFDKNESKIFCNFIFVLYFLSLFFSLFFLLDFLAFFFSLSFFLLSFFFFFSFFSFLFLFFFFFFFQV